VADDITTESAMTDCSLSGPRTSVPPISLISAHHAVIAVVISAFWGSLRLAVIVKPEMPSGRESTVIGKSIELPVVGIVPPCAVTVVAVTVPMQTNRSMTAAMIGLRLCVFIFSLSIYL
jgi:hypothetical protein